MIKFALLCVTVATAFAQKTVVVRPVEVDDLLVNPEMGIQTFQRSNGDPINLGSRWSEAGASVAPASASGKADCPEGSIACYRWCWSGLEPQPRTYVCAAIALAIE